MESVAMEFMDMYPSTKSRPFHLESEHPGTINQNHCPSKASLSMLGLEFQGRKKRHAISTAPSCCQQWCCWEAWSRLRGLAVVPGSVAGKVAQPTWWSLCQSVPTWAYVASGLMRLSTNSLRSAKPFHSGTSLRHYHIFYYHDRLNSVHLWHGLVDSC